MPGGATFGGACWSNIEFRCIRTTGNTLGRKLKVVFICKAKKG